MPYTDSEVAEEVDDMPDSLRDGTESDDIEIPGEDISGAKAMSNEDWIEPAKGVIGRIEKVLVDTFTPDGQTEWFKVSLKLYIKVGKAGVDGKGRYAGKVFFPRILVAVNRDAYDFTKNADGKPTDYYKVGSGSAFGEYNELLTALGYPTNPAPLNTRAMRAEMTGRDITFDISKDKRQVKNSAGKYVKVDGEFENHLRNLRPVKAVTQETAETAAA